MRIRAMWADGTLKDRLRRVAASLAFPSMLTIMFSPIAGAFGQSQTKPPAAPPAVRRTAVPKAKPSIDALLLRVEEYWRLLAAGNKSRATNYVEASCRDAFSRWRMPAFSSPRLTRLEPEPSGKEVAVTVVVNRNLPLLGHEVDWPVTDRWVFSRGEWWVVFKDETRMVFAGASASRTTAKDETEALEKSRAALLSRFQFERDEFDLGTIRGGTTPEFSISYTLAGDRPLEAALESKVLDLIGLTDGVLKPGPNQKIQVQLITAGLAEGPIREKFSLFVREDNIVASREFTLHAVVYAPFSASPRVIRLRPGETTIALEIRNNSPVEAVFVSSYAESGMLEAGPLPQSVPAGGHCTLIVRLTRISTAKNLREQLGIKLGKAVEGLESLIVPALINFVEAPKKQTPTVLSDKELQDLIRKARPEVPSP
jgi:hypothetical protein